MMKLSNDDIIRLVKTTEWSKDDVARLVEVSGVLKDKTNMANKSLLRHLPDNPRAHDVHYEHCCVEHGCKYGDDDCPVWLGKQRQARPCQDCGTATGIFTHPIVPLLVELRDREAYLKGKQGEE